MNKINEASAKSALFAEPCSSIERFYEDAQQLEKDLNAEWKALYNADLGFEYELEKSERLRFFAHLELERFFSTSNFFSNFCSNFLTRRE